jgi:uncharacterized protein (DUF1697 family)
LHLFYRTIFELETRSKPSLTKIEGLSGAQIANSPNRTNSTKVLIRSLDEMREVMQSLPASWANHQQMKSDVLFLWEEIDSPSIVQQLPIKPGVGTVIYVPGAILWSVDRANSGKSGMSKISGTNMYQNITIRNVNTVRKIYALMQESENSA